MNPSEKNVCILDYGSGNVRSVYNLISKFPVQVYISNKVSDMEKATHFILPGVGSFWGAMERIKKHIALEELKKEVFVHKKPFLGICVGMQVLADYGNEFGRHQGLGWIKGSVEKLAVEQPLPHMGWNNITIRNETALVGGLTDKADFYFVHSYAFKPEDEQQVVATTHYGKEFTSIIRSENICGVQFHPEKSQQAGKLLLKNFLS